MAWRIPRVSEKLLVLGAALTLLTAGAERAGLLEIPENVLYDNRAKFCQHFAPPPSPDIVHLDIDDSSMQAVGLWPWPRAVLADMMDEVNLAGPKAVMFDVLFVDPARVEWEPETAADGSKQLLKIDNDAILAASIQRMGNALIPVSLVIEEPAPASPLELRMREVFEKNLELDEQQAAKLVPEAGTSSTVWLSAFLAARRYIAKQRVSEAWDRIGSTDWLEADDLPYEPSMPTGAAAPLTQPEGTTQPTSTPTTQPAEATKPTSTATTQPTGATQPTSTPTSQPAATADLLMSLPLAGVLERQIFVQLLPNMDLSTNSPILRTVDEAFHEVRAERALRRLSFPIPGALPHLFHPTQTLFPIPRLSEAAAATAFVNYPLSRDGKIRAVPLMVQYDGRMYPQMGLMLASMMLGVSPRDFHYTPDTITIPMTGKPDGNGGVWRHDINIPIQTYYSSELKQPVPTYFEIPWYGDKDWAAMYDQAHPRAQKQHLSITVVHDVCESRRRIEDLNRKIDGFLHTILEITGDATLRAFLAHPPPPQVPLSRQAIVAAAFKILAGENIPLDKSPDDKDITDESDRILFRTIRALRKADLDSVGLSAQLGNQRAFLRAQLHNKGVLIGAVATGMDLKATSIHPAAPGVTVHATIANGILTGRMWREAPGWVTTLITIALGLITTVLAARLAPPIALASSLALLLSYLLINCELLFDYCNVIVGLAGPLIAIALVWSVCTLSRLVTEKRERARITKRFSNYVDPTLVNWVINHPEQTRFDGETREMSMAFSDLVGFTTLTEKLGQNAMPILKEYMGKMIPTIRDHKGFIGCLMGDGIYFFFGAPEPDEHHALHAVKSVCAMHGKLDELNESFLKRGLPTLGMRVGVTTGHVVVGDAGCPPVRSDYTALGDSVNLAARLETANKVFGTHSLVSGRTVELLNGSFLMRPVAKLRVKGKEEAVVVYEPLCTMEAATDEKRRIVECSEQVVSAFQSARFDECIAAANILEQEIAHSKKLAHLYRNLAQQYLAELPADFDGGVTLTEK